MDLPAHPRGGVQIGVSDMLSHRDCPMRMEFSMRRHTIGESPESWSPANAYGSAIHLCVEMLDNGATHQEAATAAFAKFGKWLEPADLDMLFSDMEKYEDRDMIGVRTILNEGEISLPLFVHPRVGQVWYRAKIDRLYQSIDDPSFFIHIDYKSSKHVKSEDEVHKDPQIWSYNLAIMYYLEDLFPELEKIRLQQVYDQLKFGQVNTSKGPNQRESIRQWLITAATTVIDDMLMEPTFNEWCPWCPLLMDCDVIRHQLSDWALTRIGALMTREPKLKKDGTPSKVMAPPQLNPEGIRLYIGLQKDVKRAHAALKLFDETLTRALKEMPAERLAEYGKEAKQRSQDVFTTEAKRAIVDEVGLSEFLYLADISKASVERFYGEDKDRAGEVLRHAVKQGHYTIIQDIRE
jgi:hypothetical protein